MGAPVHSLALGFTCALLLASQVGSAPPSLSEDASTRGLNLLDQTKAGIDYLLPQTVIPLEYHLNLDVDLPDKFTGSVEILTVAVQEVSYITLHMDSKTLSIDSVSLSEGGVKIEITSLKPALDMVIFRLNKPLVLGEKYTLSIKYTGKLKMDMKGFYRSSYNTSTGETRWMAATQFEPVHARSAFPCFDEPQYKAKFFISIIHASDLQALSNMRTLNFEEDVRSGKTVSRFEPTPPMSSYLVAFIISDLKPKENLSNNPPFSVYMREEKLKEAAYAIEVGPQTLQKLAYYTGIPFELPKLDLIAIPDFSAGAMENWGLITYRESSLMYQKGESTESAMQSIGLVIAHEEAHMWFGDLVSPARWGYIWLNEGFARYFQYVSFDMVKDDWRLMDTFVVQTLQSAMTVDALENTRSLTCEVYSPAEIQGVFDRITYDKGASILHMTRNFLGATPFQLGIQEYLKKMQHSVAVPADLFSALNSNAYPGSLPEKKSVGDILDSWTTQPGFPVVTVKKHGDHLMVTQARYLSTGPSPDSGSTSLWWIPFTYTTELAPNFESTREITWLEPEQKETHLNFKGEGWVIANIQETGFYRVNYEPENWKQISKYLLTANHQKIHVLNKAQILDDSLTLARSGHLEYSVALELTKYLSNETDPIPWNAALAQLSFLNDMLSKTRAYDSFKKYVLGITDNIYTHIGFDEKPMDRHLTKVLRISILKWACNLGNPNCLEAAKTKFEEMKKGKKIIPEIRSAVYCTVLRNVDSQEDWDLLWNRFKDVQTVAGEKDVILSSLGCTKNKERLARFLNMSLDQSQVRPQDASSVFASVVGGNPDNFEVASSFLRDKFEKITASYGSIAIIGKMVEALAAKVSSKAEADSLEEFFKEHSEELKGVSEAVSRSQETARQRQAWIEKHLTTLTEWMDDAIKVTTDKPSPDSAHATVFSPVTLLGILCLRILFGIHL